LSLTQRLGKRGRFAKVSLYVFRTNKEESVELESYFDFVDDRCILLKGTRIGIETILQDYELGATPEEILIRYPTLSLQQVYAAITYYLANRQVVDAYLEKVRRQQEDAWQEQQRHPSEFVRSLRERLEHKREMLLKERRQSIAVTP